MLICLLTTHKLRSNASNDCRKPRVATARRESHDLYNIYCKSRDDLTSVHISGTKIFKRTMIFMILVNCEYIWRYKEASLILCIENTYTEMRDLGLFSSVHIALVDTTASKHDATLEVIVSTSNSIDNCYNNITTI